MLSILEAELELAVFRLVDHSIDKDTYDLIFTTRTTNGFESTHIVDSNNPDYRQIVALIARKATNDTFSNHVPAYSTGETTTDKGGDSSCTLSEDDVTIVYDREFNDYSHNGYVIGKLEVFIAKCLELKMRLTIKELS